MVFLTNVLADIAQGTPDKLTVASAGKIVGDWARTVVAAMEELGLNGAGKKAIAMRWIGEISDLVIARIPLPLWLRPFAPLVRRAAKQLLVALGDGLIEAAVDALREQQQANGAA